MKQLVSLTVNGQGHDLVTRVERTLLDVLRDDLGLTGSKRGCDLGACGACAVLLDGRPVNSCLTLAVEASGHEVVTIEGLAGSGSLDPAQEAFVAHGAVQCGFCTPGMMIAVKALLDETPSPAEAEIREALSGNLCRCTGYVKVLAAVRSVINGAGSHLARAATDRSGLAGPATP
jgi:carbon-monoxide dehydrogenase small subunit